MMDTVESDTNTKNDNLGWADAMSQILKTKPDKKRKKTIILSKAKKLPVVKEEEKKIVKSVDGKLKKVDWISKGRQKPNVLDKDREKKLSKIAVRGIVQLFNAVKQQQKKLNINTEDKSKAIKPSEKVINKSTFLDILQRRPTKLSTEDEKVEEIKEDPEENGDNEENSEMWSVLRDNFIQNSKSKNWDEIENF